jgi:hypothetical protein
MQTFFASTSPAVRAQERPPPLSPAERRASSFLIGTGLAIAGLWCLSLPGAFRNGLLRYAGAAETGNIPLFHLAAEAAMAMTSVASGRALRARRPYGRGAALAACGMLEYSAINSSGWLLRNQPGVVIVTGGTLIGATVTMSSLLRLESDEKQRQSPQPSAVPATAG